MKETISQEKRDQLDALQHKLFEWTASQDVPTVDMIHALLNQVAVIVAGIQLTRPEEDLKAKVLENLATRVDIYTDRMTKTQGTC